MNKYFMLTWLRDRSHFHFIDEVEDEMENLVNYASERNLNNQNYFIVLSQYKMQSASLMGEKYVSSSGGKSS